MLRKLNQVSYEVQIGRRVSTLHINLLRPWIEREAIPNMTQQVNVTLIANPCEASYEMLPGLDDDDQSGQPEIGLSLSIPQRETLYKICSDYADVFREKLGRTHLLEHKIILKDENPCVSRCYRIPDSVREEVAKQIQIMLQDGVIRPSASNWRSPLVCVKKPGNRGLRIAADLRLVNEKTLGDEYPAPDAREILDRSARAKFISTVDLKNAFWKVPLSESSRKYTAFEAGHKLWEFCVAPMGAKNSSKTFQRLMDMVLEGAEEFAAAHIDDIIIFSESWEDHVVHLKEVCERLRKSGLTAKLAKCQFAKPSLKVLGHIIENGTIRPDDEKVQCIKDCPIPRTKRQVRAFIGMASYHRHFIKSFSEIAWPLTNLTKKSQPDKIVFGPDELRAFNELKTALCTAPCLVAPDPKKPYILHVDSSNFAAGSCILQLDDNGLERPIAYASRKLLPNQVNFSVVEKEAHAIIYFLSYFEPYLYGNKITVKSDHHSLQWLKSFQNSNPRLLRWSMVLARFDVQIVYVRGVQNGVADFLSRPFQHQPGGQ